MGTDAKLLTALLNNIKQTTDKFWSGKKVIRPITFISVDGRAISVEELAAKPARAFIVGNGVPLLDLEVVHLQQLYNSITGLRLNVHLIDAVATSMSALALPASPKVKLGTNWVHLSTSVYSTPGPCGPLTEEDVAVRVAVCFKLDCKAQTLSTEQAIQAAAGLKGWYRSTPLPGRVLVQEAEPVQAAAYGGL